MLQPHKRLEVYGCPTFYGMEGTGRTTGGLVTANIILADRTIDKEPKESAKKTERPQVKPAHEFAWFSR